MELQFFKFPVKVYDGFSVAKAMFKEQKNLSEDVENTADPEKAAWVLGYARIEKNQLLGWIDHFEEGSQVSDIAGKGFDMTMVFTKELGSFECLWKREKFEAKYSEFMAKSV